MIQPLFTVAVITYNSGRWLQQSIDSILSSTYENFELIISDDCSSDNSWELIEQYKDPRIIAIRCASNIGEYPNRNKVLKQAKGRYIMFIDGDDILYRETLQEYSKLIIAFPNVPAIWGVYPLYFDFVVFPYLFTSYQLCALNFLSNYPITATGFAESLFGVHELNKIGGFSEKFAIGDIYIKKKFCCFYDVLLIPAGKAFWRQHPGQASNRVRSFYRNLIETFQIDKELLNSNLLSFSTEEIATSKRNFQIRSIKLIVKNTLQKGKVNDFFKLMNKLLVPYKNLRFLVTKGKYNYKANSSGLNPLLNDYNLKKHGAPTNN